MASRRTGAQLLREDCDELCAGAASGSATHQRARIRFDLTVHEQRLRGMPCLAIRQEEEPLDELAHTALLDLDVQRHDRRYHTLATHSNRIPSIMRENADVTTMPRQRAADSVAYQLALAATITIVLCVSLASAALAQTRAASPPRQSAPLVVGETFTIGSAVLGETRRINVYLPPAYIDSARRLPVLYMPDGGLREDFLHVAGLVQVLVGNGSMRPFILVGIENTERRRDLTGPTRNPKDSAIAAHVGGSAAFRKFIRTELMPEIRARYATTGETAIMGESLAGLFVVETLVQEPGLFDSYIAFDPSLWWDDERLVSDAAVQLARRDGPRKTIFLASSSDAMTLTQRLASTIRHLPNAGVECVYQPMPEETHATIYHPAALLALRTLFRPVGPR